MTRRNARQLVAPSETCVVNDDGSITFRGRQIIVPGVHLEEVIGSGANGFVVRGHHKILSVPLAVKFWVSLRTQDARDKMAQGIAEIKKQIRAEYYRSVLLQRTAGESAGVFYASMDLFRGLTLKCWLKDAHPLGLRRLLAHHLVDEVCGMAHGGLHHGDLHTRNIMIAAEDVPLLDGVLPRFAIIDFGTSLFASRPASRTRHWRVFTETIDRLVFPFELRALGPGSLPISGTAISIRTWYRARLASMRHALIQLGAEWLISPEETHKFEKRKWDSREVMLSSLFPVPVGVLDLTSKLIGDGCLILSEAALGPGQLWWPHDRPLDSATLDGVGPPWTTSMMDRAWW